MNAAAMPQSSPRKAKATPLSSKRLRHRAFIPRASAHVYKCQSNESGTLRIAVSRCVNEPAFCARRAHTCLHSFDR